jgi:hypothetical protein
MWNKPKRVFMWDELRQGEGVRNGYPEKCYFPQWSYSQRSLVGSSSMKSQKWPLKNENDQQAV